MRVSWIHVLTMVGALSLTAGSALFAEGQPGVPPPANPQSTAVYTNYNVSTQHFHFINDFDNIMNLGGELNIRTGGLCGGMSYAAADYYYAQKAFPKQNYRPAEGTVLQSYLYNRQQTSITSNLDKWAEVITNPFGWRNSEFFNWGLQGTGGGRIEELRSFIDFGRPALLGLKGANGTGNHQVLAYGYDMGRYKGDLGDFKGDFKIFILDPNFPDEPQTLVANVEKEYYYYINHADENYQTWFVDKNYHAEVPPTIPEDSYPDDGKVYKLRVRFQTGADDLRGGNDNISVRLFLLDGTEFSFPNVNNGKRWISNYDQWVELPLPYGIASGDIYSMRVSASFTGGISGDNWDMSVADVHTVTGAGSTYFAHMNAHRFTGDDRDFQEILQVPAYQITSFVLTISTGGDDLRGGNDNINVTVHAAGNPDQTIYNVNRGARFADNTTQQVIVQLNKPVRLSQLSGMTLSTTFGGGMGGDNWNMNSVSVFARGIGFNKVVGSAGSKRFTGDSKSLYVPLKP